MRKNSEWCAWTGNGSGAGRAEKRLTDTNKLPIPIRPIPIWLIAIFGWTIAEMKNKLRQAATTGHVDGENENVGKERTTTAKNSKKRPQDTIKSDETDAKSGKKAKKSIKGPEVIDQVEGNPYEDEVKLLKNKSKFWKNLFEEDIRGKREKGWNEVESKSQELSQRYAWAIPDEKCLKIIENFAPLIEIGAGKGYWSRLLQNRGVDISPFDKFANELDSLWTDVKPGDPSTLLKDSIKQQNRNLFLCYPDEAESMAATCLENFHGEYIVHVGEMIFTGTLMGAPIAPFGRTSSADFQVSLAESFHCVLVVQLCNQFPISSDCLSVWKRTKFVRGKEVTSFAGSVNSHNEPAPPAVEKNKKPSADVEFLSLADLEQLRDGNKSQPKQKKGKKTSSGDEEFINPGSLAQLREMALDQQYNEDEEAQWASIPQEEQLPINRAAPFLAHLL
jgi:hypothetical protein